MDTLNNWCIKIDIENRDIVIQYFKKEYVANYNGVIGDYYGHYNNDCFRNSKPFGKELTFEEFKTQILGQGYKCEILGTSTNNPPINKFLSELDKDTNQIQSDGGSTQYYQIEITNTNGEKFNCELNDILRDVFNNQWDLCNIVKASRRISESRKGQGKKDVSIQYDANKIIWFAEEIKKLNK